MSPRYPSTLEGQRDFQRPADNAWRTVSYYSEPMARALGFVIIFGVLAVLLLALAIGIVWLAELQSMWALILFALFGLVGFLALVPTYFRHTQEGIDHARIESEEAISLARIEADNNVQLAQAQALLQSYENQRMQLELGRESVLSHPAQSEANALSTFVPPVAPDERPAHWQHPQPLRQDRMVTVMLEWAGEVYAASSTDGRINTVVPWSARGRLGPNDAKRAQDWLQLASNAAGEWIVEYSKPRRAWYINVRRYPGPAELLDALSAVVPPRGGVE